MNYTSLWHILTSYLLLSLPSVKRKYSDRIAISRLPLSVQLKMRKLKLKMMNPIIAEIYLKALEKGIVNSIVNQ